MSNNIQDAFICVRQENPDIFSVGDELTIGKKGKTIFTFKKEYSETS